MANSFINKKVDLTTTDLTVLYTVPSFKAAVVKSLLVSEDAGSGSTITITLVNSSGAIFNLFKDKAIGSKATTEILTQLGVPGGFALKGANALLKAKNLGILKEIIEAEPTDGLWDDGRTDVSQLGMSYKELEEAQEKQKGITMKLWMVTLVQHVFRLALLKLWFLVIKKIQIVRLIK